MSGGGKQAAGSFLQKLRDRFRDRWVVGANLAPYLPEQSASQQLRYPTPERIREPVNTVHSYPETIFDTNLYKRDAIKLTPPPGADPALFEERINTDYAAAGHFPRHTPHPWWLYDEKALIAKRKMYLESGGLISAGAFWRRDRDSIQVRRPDDE